MVFEKIFSIPIVNILLGLNFILTPLNLINNSSDNNLKNKEEINFSQQYLFPTREPTLFPLRDWNFSDPKIDAKSAVIYDLNSDKFLFEKNSKTKLPIASLTKLMTAIVIIENMNLDDNVEIKESALEKSKILNGGNDLYLNEIIKARDLLKLMLIKSSNDAAFAFEEHFLDNYGRALVKEMNRKAELLLMNSSFFTEPTGLDDQNSFSTSEDLVKLVKYALRYDFLFEILKTPKSEIASVDGKLKHRFFNTNKLLGDLTNIIGGKTGFTESSGGSIILVVKAPNKENKLIIIVLGSNDRFNDAKKLVEWVNKAYIWE